MTVDVLELQDLALGVVHDAVELITAKRREFELGDGLAAHATAKSSAVDPVTEVDTASEKHIVDSLLAARPHDGILGEEGSSVAGNSGVTWIVDPIDGTVNFLYGIEEYAVSVGAVVDGELAVGVVANVAKNVVYYAACGHGAFVQRGDGQACRLSCRDESAPALALIATGFSYSAARRAAQADILRTLLPQVRDIRRMGAAALDLCRVAEGTVDAYYEHGIHAWDYAAGAVIAREAGAIVHEPGIQATGVEGNVVYAASEALMPALETVLNDCGALAAIPD